MNEGRAIAAWDNPAYQRFQSARGSGTELAVTFGNGEEATVDLRSLMGAPTADVAWESLEVEPFEIRIQVDGSLVEIPWLDVRALSDVAFAGHLAESAAESAKLVGHRLRNLRESRKLSSRELAERAGLSPQSLSRIERGRHDVVFSTLQRLLAAMNYGLGDLAAADAVSVDPTEIRGALTRSGLASETVDRLLRGVRDTPGMLRRVHAVFGWSATDLLSDTPPPLLAGGAFGGRFKDSKASRRSAAYVLYAHKVALLADQAAARGPYVPPPSDESQLAAEIRASQGDLSFRSVLDYCWESGIVIVPLADPGQFHGACWLVEGRPVIVLKQRSTLESRWVFDLGHEICHVLRHLGGGREGIVEIQEIGESDEEEEVEASEFSGVLLLGDPDRLAHQVVDTAKGKGPRIWRAVDAVAEEEGVDRGVLANYLAYRLDNEGIFKGGWGAAAKLQQGEDRAEEIVREALDTRLDWNALTADDSEILAASLGLEPVS
jgi:transcriptional regulator with XRE-family HTH domain/Zn-dependent peptidase ImmA (M78 family)